jgi:hypothetical protein
MELLKTFQNTRWKLSKTRGACMAIHAQKTKPGALLIGRRPLLANGGIPRCEPAEHVLPIIRRLRGYAQLAGWLANPRRYMYISIYRSLVMARFKILKAQNLTYNLQKTQN